MTVEASAVTVATGLGEVQSAVDKLDLADPFGLPGVVEIST
jgi:hypothetical protein